MMSAKWAALGFLKIKVFWIEGYDVIISVHDVTNKILSRDSIIFQMQLCDQNSVNLAFL